MNKDFELIGIVGCGKMGRIYHKVFDPLCDRFVIVDPRAADDLEPRPYTTLGDVPGDLFNLVQVWCICTPTEKHFESLETILSRNPCARVIVEKPACLSFEVDPFQALLKKYREARVLINRQYADSRAVRELVNALKRYDVAHIDLIRIEFSKDRRPDIDAGRFVDSHFGGPGIRMVAHPDDHSTTPRPRQLGHVSGPDIGIAGDLGSRAIHLRAWRTKRVTVRNEDPAQVVDAGQVRVCLIHAV